MKTLLTALALAVVAPVTAQITLDSTQMDVDTVYHGLDIPWEMRFDATGDLWVTERIGRVNRITPSTGANQVVLDITDTVYQDSESGLLGMALHPQFTATGGSNDWVYLVYTYLDGADILERLVRYRYNGTSLTAPQILLDDIPGYVTHDGSRLLFLQDGTLLMSTGDAQMQDSAQSYTSMNGKILRMNADGSLPLDNPTPGSYIYSSGHRNPQGMIQAPWGTVYISEHGPSTDDEFQIVLPGRNYGWPVVRGYCNASGELAFCADSNVVEPLQAWTPTIAPADLEWYPYPLIPEFENTMLMAVLKNMMVVAFRFNATHDAVTSSVSYLQSDFGRIRDILADPADGSILIATNGLSWQNTNPNTHSIIRLKPATFAGITTPKADNARIFPSPASNTATIQRSGTFSYAIFSPAGLPVASGTANNAVEISLTHLPEGVYMVQIDSAESAAFHKLMVTR
jgi:glucose/arabinose dehydrogenase